MTPREEELIADGLANIAFKWREKLLPYITEDEPICLPECPLSEYPTAAREECLAALDELGIMEFDHLFSVMLCKDQIIVSTGDGDYDYPVAPITH